MNLKNKKIAIIGGGPGGLTLAKLLQLSGLKVKVYERDKDKTARVQGSPLDLHEGSGLAALSQAGLLDEFKRNFLRGADRMKIMNESAEVFFSDHDRKVEENFDNPFFRPEIDRGVLRKILLDSLATDIVVWNSHFISMEPSGDGWLLHFQDRTAEYADLVIGADGANSRIRPYLTDVKPFYSGITMLEGTITDASVTAPNISALLNGGKIMAFGNTKNILLGQKGNGEIGFYLSFKTDDNVPGSSAPDFTDQTRVMHWYQKEYAEWNIIWQELLENATTPLIPRPIVCMPLDTNWRSKHNLTLLGDAAHVMPPFAGEGVNMAMLDALELCTCLTSDRHATLLDAISEYEITMHIRASEVARASLHNGEKMHSENALHEMLYFFNSH